MKRLRSRKATKINLSTTGGSLGKTRVRARTTSLTKAGPFRGTVYAWTGRPRSRFRYRRLPFAKSLSKKNVLAARVLEDSYRKGVAIAAVGDLEDLF